MTTADANVDATADVDAAVDAAVDAGEDAGVDAALRDAGQPDAEQDAAPADTGPPDAPGDAPPGPGDLVIVEIQGNPQRATDEEAEYFEIVNVSSRTLDLQGVVITHVDWEGGEPDRSVGQWTIDESVNVGPSERALLTRSGGGFFGGATPDHVYDGFVFNNGGARRNRLRLMVPGWDDTGPLVPTDIIDEVRTDEGAFDNPLRGRAWSLSPSSALNTTANDTPSAWCYTEATAALEYRTDNWGTPRAPNQCAE